MSRRRRRKLSQTDQTPLQLVDSACATIACCAPPPISGAGSGVNAAVLSVEPENHRQRRALLARQRRRAR
jgi:hypothetical protein